MKVKVRVAQPFPTLCNPLDCSPPGSSVHAGVDCHALLQGIFLTQGLNLGLQHCRQILNRLHNQLYFNKKMNKKTKANNKTK